QIFHRSPAIVRRLDMALARDLIAVSATNRTDPFAFLAAHSLHRQRQQDLLFDYIGELETQTLVKANFSLTLVDLDLVRLQVVERRTIKQVETYFQREGGQGQTAVAIRFQGAGILALNANLTAGVAQKPGRPRRANWGNLPQPRIRKIDRPRFKGFVKLNPPHLHLFDVQEHTTSASRRRAIGNLSKQ